MDSICLAFVDLHVMLTRSLPIKTCIKSFQNSACLNGFDVLKKRFTCYDFLVLSAKPYV